MWRLLRYLSLIWWIIRASFAFKLFVIIFIIVVLCYVILVLGNHILRRHKLLVLISHEHLILSLIHLREHDLLLLRELVQLTILLQLLLIKLHLLFISKVLILHWIFKIQIFHFFLEILHFCSQKIYITLTFHFLESIKINLRLVSWFW